MNQETKVFFQALLDVVRKSLRIFHFGEKNYKKRREIRLSNTAFNKNTYEVGKMFGPKM